MKRVTRKALQIGRTTAVAAAMVSAGLLVALAGAPREAEATFPGDDGRIVFASNRTTGEGAVNPEGDFEIYTMNADGTGQLNLTSASAGDFTPDWQPVERQY